MNDAFLGFINYLISLNQAIQGSYQLKVIKWVFIVYNLVLIFDYIFLVLKYPLIFDYVFRGNRKFTKEDLKKVDKKHASNDIWKKIEDKLNSVNSNDWKLAIIEADKYFDNLLKKIGTEGTTMGERLKNIADVKIMEEIKDLWEAHKIRNQIVHEVNFNLTSDLARKTVHIFKNAGEKLEN